MGKITMIKMYYVLINIFLAVLAVSLIVYVLISIVLYWLGLWSMSLIFLGLLIISLFGLGVLLLSFADDYKWSVFHEECRKEKVAATLERYDKWCKDNVL